MRQVTTGVEIIRLILCFGVENFLFKKLEIIHEALGILRLTFVNTTLIYKCLPVLRKNITEYHQL